MSSNELSNRKSILHKYLENPSRSAASIAKELKLPSSTARSVIKRFKSSLSIERKPGSGRKKGPLNKKLHQKVVKSIKSNPGLSQSDLAKRHGTSETFIRKTIEGAGLKCYRAIKTPRRNDKQDINAKKRARLLQDNVLTKFNGCLIMDDETYLKCDHKQIPGRKFYYSSKRLNVSSKFKYVQVEKYAKKMLIWQAICSCGIKSRPFFTAKTLNSELYVKECLKERLLPMIRSHSSPVKFWPDLASCHYSKFTTKWYQENKVDVIPKEWKELVFITSIVVHVFIVQ